MTRWHGVLKKWWTSKKKISILFTLIHRAFTIIYIIDEKFEGIILWHPVGPSGVSLVLVEALTNKSVDTSRF